MFVCNLFFLSLPIFISGLPTELMADEAATSEEQAISENTAVSEQPQSESGQPAGKSVSTEEWDITADKITRYEKPHSIVAEGSIVLVKRKKVPVVLQKTDGDLGELAPGEQVTEWDVLLEEEVVAEEITPDDVVEEQEIVYKTQATIKADWAAYDIALNTIKARGNVSIVADGQSIFAEQAVINLEQETGTFKNATVLGNEKDMHLEAEVIEKIGFKTYHIENGWIITCKIPNNETAPWSFAASDAVIEQDGYARLKHARFRIKDVPVFYSPWLVIPAKNKRESRERLSPTGIKHR